MNPESNINQTNEGVKPVSFYEAEAVLRNVRSETPEEYLARVAKWDKAAGGSGTTGRRNSTVHNLTHPESAVFDEEGNIIPTEATIRKNGFDPETTRSQIERYNSLREERTTQVQGSNDATLSIGIIKSRKQVIEDYLEEGHYNH